MYLGPIAATTTTIITAVFPVVAISTVAKFKSHAVICAIRVHRFVVTAVTTASEHSIGTLAIHR